MNTEAKRYDEVPYRSTPYLESHPDRMFVNARLFGVSAPAVQTARVLELGCASGGNLLPMAIQLPDATFVGADVSRVQVTSGREVAEAAGIRNVEIRQADIMDVDASWGTFDYIVAHGVYSWVPRDVQDRILELCCTNLADNGVAYISYNTYPGWHMRGMIRDMMLYHVAQFDEANQRIEQAQTLLGFLAKATKPDNPYGELLRNEVQVLSKHPGSYLYHDHLSTENAPLWFHQFMERARAAGLEYLSEAELSAVMTSRLPEEVARTLERVPGDLVRTEQYMDFVVNRHFRRTLLVKKGVPLDRNVAWTRGLGLHVAGPFEHEGEPDLSPGVRMTFRTFDDQSLSTDVPLLKAVWLRLAREWPATLTLEQLAGDAVEMCGVVEDRRPPTQIVAENLLVAFANDAVELLPRPRRCVPTVSERPVACPLARAVAARGVEHIPTRRHGVAPSDSYARCVIGLLDGTRDRGAIVEDLVQLSLDGVLVARRDGQVERDPAVLREAYDGIIDKSLRHLARSALLVA